MSASIIIVTYNSAGQIGACLDAVARLEPPGAHQVVVLDNASQDGTAALVRERHPAVTLLALDENYGFAGGVNRAVAAASGERVLLLNPDAAPHPAWARQLLAALDDPRAGVVGSKVLGPDQRIQSLGSDLDARALISTHRGEGEPDDGRHAGRAEVWAVHGAAMGFRRAVWQQLGGFDEGFFPAYWEEVDFCERARRAGLRVEVEPAAQVVHAEASSTTKYSAQFYGYYHRSRLRYAAKWLDWPALWGDLRPAEHARLAAAPPLDRRVARLVYTRGVPPLRPLTADERAEVRGFGQALRAGALPDDGYDALLHQIGEAERASVHHEVEFRSALPLVARLRGAWNSVATRWYVRPNFDQQTRFNLAAQRALVALLEQSSAQMAASAFDIALLAWRAGVAD